MTEPELDPQDDLLNIHRWVRIMCDNTAEGVWDRIGRACAVDGLPASDALKQRLLHWQEDYEQLDDRAFNRETVDWSAFSQTGLAIAHDLKAAMPDWTVIYHDEAKARAQRGQPLRRDEFEHEVFL